MAAIEVYLSPLGLVIALGWNFAVLASIQLTVRLIRAFSLRTTALAAVLLTSATVPLTLVYNLILRNAIGWLPALNLAEQLPQLGQQLPRRPGGRVQAPPRGQRLSDLLSLGGPDVLASEAAVLEPPAVQVGAVQRVLACRAPAVRAVAALALVVQASW